MYHKYGLGVMISDPDIRNTVKGLSCAIDNGAFQYHRRGYPFLEGRFWRILEKAYDTGIDPDFIVCPDLVGQGDRSLHFSLDWARRLKTKNLALAVQDGMEEVTVLPYTGLFKVLFIGGSVEWKWKTASSWVEFAHNHNMLCHIGQCGTIENLRIAKRIGTDSVDSTSLCRNRSWKILEELEDQTCLELQEQ